MIGVKVQSSLETHGFLVFMKEKNMVLYVHRNHKRFIRDGEVGGSSEREGEHSLTL